MRRRRLLHLAAASALASAALIAAANGCTFVAGLNENYGTVDTDATTIIVVAQSDAGANDGSTSRADGAPATGDSGGSGPDAQPSDSGPVYTLCTQPGWHVDCTFGDGGILVLPSPDDPAADAGPSDGAPPRFATYNGTPAVAVASDGTMFAASRFVNNDPHYGRYLSTTTPSGTSTFNELDALAPFNGNDFADFRVFDGGTLLAALDVTDFGGPTTFGAYAFVDGSVAASSILMPDPPNTFPGSQLYAFASFDGRTAQAIIAKTDTTFTHSFAVGSFPLGGDASTATDGSIDVFGDFASGSSRAFSFDVDGGRLLIAAASTTAASSMSGYELVASDGSVGPSQTCPSTAGAITDTAQLGNDVVGIGTSTAGQTFALFSIEDGGSCRPLAADPGPTMEGTAGVAYLSSNDAVSFDEILYLPGSAGFSRLSLARFDGSGAIDSHGYVLVTLPTDTTMVGRPVRFGAFMYVPLSVGVAANPTGANPFLHIEILRFGWSN